MNMSDKIAVCSRSFSKHIDLRQELSSLYKNVTFNDEGLKLEGSSLINFLEGHNKAITALEVINEEVLSQLPDLKVISKYGVGVDMIDFAALKRFGISFGWEAGVNKRSVSELILANMIACMRHLPLASEQAREGIWKQVIGRQLTGKIIGIIGCGNVGKDLVQLLAPFSCRILVNDIVDYPDFYKKYSVETADLDTLLSQSDIVTIHTPLDETTRGLISADKINLMRDGAILLNAARGGIVDEVALKNSLLDKKLSAAAFDVFAEEPPQDKELVTLSNFIVTPHIGGSSEEAILAMGRAAIRGLDKYDIV